MKYIGQVVNKIHKAMPKDYGAFKIIKSNRNINRSHLLKLIKSMKEEYHADACPMTCNEKFEIIDGQHRYKAAMELELPVYYLIKEGLTIKQAVQMNINSKNWKDWDYQKHYSEEGNPDYKRYKLFRTEFEFGHNPTLKILADCTGDGGTLGEMFREGALEIKNWEVAKTKARMISQAKTVYAGGWKKQAFVTIMMKLFEYDGYDHEKFIKKLNQNKYDKIRELRVAGTNRNALIKAIEDIYNQNASVSQIVRFYGNI